MENYDKTREDDSDIYRDELDLTEQELSILLDQGEVDLRRIVTPHPGKVDLRGMVYDWLDAGSVEALCPWRKTYSVAGLSVTVGSRKVEKHPTLWVFVWVVQLRICPSNK